MNSTIALFTGFETGLKVPRIGPRPRSTAANFGSTRASSKLSTKNGLAVGNTYGTCYHVVLPRKEVIHPHLPVRIPCYDFTPIIEFALGPSKVGTSGTPNFRGVTGGVYKLRERIHRGVLTHGY